MSTKTVKGLLGEKLGMTQVWDDNNRIVPVTVIKAGPCVVTAVRSRWRETHGRPSVAPTTRSTRLLRTVSTSGSSGIVDGYRVVVVIDKPARRRPGHPAPTATMRRR